MGCMEEMNNSKICAVCGYADNSVFLSSYLTPATFLAERYIVGKLISYNGEGALYMAFDTKNNVKATIREYMPDTLCGRKKDEESVEVNPQYVALYKTYLSEFIELNKSLMNTGGALQIQKVLDVFTENNTAYAVYEYIKGVKLKSYLSNLGGVLPWEQVRELFTPLFTTLNLIHAEGIVHRGISPSTIFLNDKSELVLINFGITASRTYGSEINHEVYPGYAAPEQYNSTARHGSHTDVYSIAAVLYKVLTGQMPPEAISRAEDDVLTEPSLINRNIPPSVSAAIMKGLIYNEQERTGTVNGFITGLFEALPVSVPDSTNEILIRKPLRKAEDEETLFSQNSYTSGSRRNNPKKNKGSYAAAITVCVMLGLVLIAFITVIVLSARNPDLFGDWGAKDPVTETEKNKNDEPENSNQSPSADSEKSEAEFNDKTNQPQNESLYIIPDFTAREYEKIKNNAAYEFLIFTATYEFNADFNEGVIFYQDKPHDTEVSKGTEISVKVSKGPENAALPSYLNHKRDDYTKILSEAKIKYTVMGEYHDEIEMGTVIRCSVQKNGSSPENSDAIQAGYIINLANGETVTVYFSLGPDPNPPEPPPEEEPEETGNEPADNAQDEGNE